MHASLLLFIALVCFATALFIPTLWWLFVWVGLNFVEVGLAYLKLGSGIFGKKEDGSLSLLESLFLLPYLTLFFVIWHLFRLINPGKPYHQLLDNVWVGRRLLAHEYPDNIEMIVDLTCELPEPRKATQNREYILLPILDAHIPEPEDIQPVLQRVKEFPGNVYIHCAQGRGRAGMFAALLLLEKGIASTVDEAIKLTQEKRPQVHVGRKQRKFMDEYAERIME